MLVKRFEIHETRNNYNQRDLEFAIYNASANDFKSLKKPSDLYKLPGDAGYGIKEKAIEGDEANQYLEELGIAVEKTT